MDCRLRGLAPPSPALARPPYLARRRAQGLSQGSRIAAERRGRQKQALQLRGTGRMCAGAAVGLRSCGELAQNKAY